MAMRGFAGDVSSARVGGAADGRRPSNECMRWAPEFVFDWCQA